jgi:hypothetical protein
MFDNFINSTIVYNEPVGAISDDGTLSITSLAADPELTIPCSIHQLNSDENIKYGRELSTVLAKLYIPTKNPDGTALSPKHYGTFTWSGYLWRIVGAPSVDMNGAQFQRLIIERDI